MLQTLLVPLSTWAAFVLHCSCWRWDAVQPTQRNPSYGAALQKGSSSCRQEVVVMGVIQSVMENVHIRTQRRKKKKRKEKKSPSFASRGWELRCGTDVCFCCSPTSSARFLCLLRGRWGRSGGVLRAPHFSMHRRAEEPFSLEIRWKEKALLPSRGTKPNGSVALCLDSPSKAETFGVCRCPLPSVLMKCNKTKPWGDCWPLCEGCSGGCGAEEGYGGTALSSHRALSARTYQPGEEAPRFISACHLRALRPGLSRGISAAVQPCGALRGGTERGGTALLSAPRRVGMRQGGNAAGTRRHRLPAGMGQVWGRAVRSLLLQRSPPRGSDVGLVGEVLLVHRGGERALGAV